MANWTTLKATIADVIKANGNQEITGDKLQSTLNNIISEVGKYATFAGVASVDTDPGMPDGYVFYIAINTGTYTHFGYSIVEGEGLVLFMYSSTWAKITIPLVLKSDITSIKQSISILQANTIPLSTSFDLDKIEALTNLSSSQEIKEAFTPTTGMGVAPITGNILRSSSSSYTKTQEISINWSDYNSTDNIYQFSYIINNVLKTFRTDISSFVEINIIALNNASSGAPTSLDFSLQVVQQRLTKTTDLIVVCKKGEILASDKAVFYRKGKYNTNSRNKQTLDYINHKYKEGWRTPHSDTNAMFLYREAIPYELNLIKLEPNIDSNPQYIGCDVWKLTVSGYDNLQDLFRASMARVYYTPDDWYIYIRNGRNGKKYEHSDFTNLQKKRKTIHAGIAIYRNDAIISNIVPFKIYFIMNDDNNYTELETPSIDSIKVKLAI